MREEVNILVVDDESLMRNLLYKILVQQNYKVELAGSVDQALEALSQKEFQLIISDIKMPERDGMELLKEVKSNYPHTGVIIMTGYKDTYNANEVLLSGAQEYITKPFSSNELTAAVKRAYGRVLSGPQKSDNPTA